MSEKRAGAETAVILHAEAAGAAVRRWAERGEQQLREASPGDVRETCSAILMLDRIGRLDAIDRADRSQYAGVLRRYLHDPPRPESLFDLTGSIVHALAAIDHVGPLDVAAVLSGGANLDRANADWRHPIAEAGRVSAMLTALILRAEINDDGDAVPAVDAILEWLDEQQPPKTGLWGSAHVAPERDAIVATAALLPFYGYLQRPVSRTGRMIDAVLMAADSGELDGCSAREQLALVEVFCTSLTSSGYRRAEIVRALNGTCSDLIRPGAADTGSGMLSDGGGASYQAWLRAAALARVCRACPDQVEGDVEAFPWREGRWPGPGFAPQPKRLTSHQRQVIERWIPEVWRRAPATSPPAAATVVIPCFNLGRYLHEAIRSVAAQTLSNVELIVVDDGSDDEFTVRALAAFERQGVDVLRQSNQGLAAARNAGVARATASYVSCLDADDRLKPDFLRASAEQLDADRSLGFVNVARRCFDELEFVVDRVVCEFPDMLIGNRAVVASLFRKAAWARVGGYFGGFSATGIEDWDFWIRLLEHGYRAGEIPEVLFEYRVRAGSMSYAMYEPRQWQSLTRELADRHAATYQLYLPAVVGELTLGLAESRNWAVAREAAVTWWERKAMAWQRTVEERDQTIEQLKGWIGDLERAKEWLEQQRQSWEATAKVAQAAVASQASASPLLPRVSGTVSADTPSNE